MDRFLSNVITTYYLSSAHTLLSSSTYIKRKKRTFFELILNNTLNENYEGDTRDPVNIALFKESSYYILRLQRGESKYDLSRENKMSPQIVARLERNWASVESFLANITIQSGKYTNESVVVYKSCHKRIDKVLYYLLKNSTHLTIGITSLLSNLNRSDHDAINRLITFFIEMDVDINACRINGSTLLGIACQNGFDSTVDFLLKSGADINIRDKECASPLYIACLSGHAKIVQYLLENGADVNFHLEPKGSPLYIAFEMQHYKIVELLIENGADVIPCQKNKAFPV